MIRTRHYSGTETVEQRKLRLARAIEVHERKVPASEPSLRGAGVVTPPRKVKFSRPKHVRRNSGYYAGNGAFIATAEAPYLELMKDVGTPRKGRAVKATKGKVHVQTNADLNLMAKMGTIHDASEL